MNFFSIFRGTAGPSHPLRVKDQLLWGALGCCFIFPFLSGAHGKVFEGLLKLVRLVLISAIRFFRYEDRLSGKKKLQSHNLAQKAAASLRASQPQSHSRAVIHEATQQAGSGDRILPFVLKLWGEGLPSAERVCQLVLLGVCVCVRL